MIKKYVKGSLKNPKGVIKALEELGGVNEWHLAGEYEECIYFTNKGNCIDHATIGTELANVITECFEEIQPIESEPEVITNLDVAKWYFDMIHEGHAVQFASRHDYILSNPFAYVNDDDETEVIEVRVDFGEWIPVEDAGIK